MTVTRVFVAVLLSYFLLDLSNPFLPGAFEFNADNSVDALSRDCSIPVDAVAMTSAPDSPRIEPVTTAPTPRHHAAARRPVVWKPYLQRAHVGGVGIPHAPADDH